MPQITRPLISITTFIFRGKGLPIGYGIDTGYLHAQRDGCFSPNCLGAAISFATAAKFLASKIVDLIQDDSYVLVGGGRSVASSMPKYMRNTGIDTLSLIIWAALSAGFGPRGEA